MGGVPGPERRPDVFLFTLDTVRADHLPTYGYDRPTAPWITEMAEDAVVFDAASATSSWTVPSVGSMLTGMLPHQLRTEAAPSVPGPDDPRPKLPSGAITLAERLKAAGYETFGITANAQLDAPLGYGQGFDHYANVGFASAESVEVEVGEIEDLVENAPGPVFVWIHLFDPHDPYMPKDLDLVEQWSPGYAAYAASTGQEALHNPRFGTMDGALRGRPDLKQEGEALDHLRALYDAEILYSDRMLESFGERLGLDDSDVLLFASDHGEEFRDHGVLGHRVNLFETTVRIPLFARWPGQWPARRVSERVSLASITPTLAALAGVPIGPDAGLAAGSLLPVLEGGAWAPFAPVIAELILGGVDTQFRAVYEENEKLVVRLDGPGRTLLYDLANDPGERTDAAGAVPTRVKELRKKMDDFLGTLPLLREEWLTGETLDEETCRQLLAMGYVDACDFGPETTPAPPDASGG